MNFPSIDIQGSILSNDIIGVNILIPNPKI
jgi:hypothetical protein